MKKFFTLLLLTLSAFTLKTQAQNTTCNAGFDFTISGLSVSFTPAITTVSTTNHQYWKFGDGAFSSAISPAHLYTSGGTFTVKHFFYRSENGGAVCIDSAEKKVTLGSTTPTCSLHAKFSFAKDVSQPNKINFTNLSTPSANVHYSKWTFGDGTYSYDLNASHVYTTSGTYTVCLTVLTSTNSATGCRRDTCQQVMVQVPPPTVCNLEPNFIWHGDILQINKIHFGNLSSHFEAHDSIWWSFGDGSYSTEGSPTHIYANAGTYNVCIRIKKYNPNLGNSCVKELCKQVVVLNECRLEASFSYEADATNKNKIYFKNTSTPATAAVNLLWSFGDGGTSSSQNPDHTYTHTGTYNVCLRISGSTTCYREICKIIEIKEPEINCNDISKFTFTRSTVNCLEFKFIPTVQNTAWKYVWSFGDGTGSTDITPSHVYPRSGNYTVYLTVYRSSNCVSTSYKVAETGACFSCSNIWVKYESVRASSMSNTVYFHALSNYPILTQTWVITKLNVTTTPITLAQNNPVYTFNEPGDYSVCIRAVTYGNCVKEYCEVIHITIANSACTLTSYPNPATNQVNLSVQLTSPEMIHLYIFNSLNILVKQKDQQGSTGNNNVTTSIEGLIPGWYTIKVIYGNHVCYAKFQKI